MKTTFNIAIVASAIMLIAARAELKWRESRKTDETIREVIEGLQEAIENQAESIERMQQQMSNVVARVSASSVSQ